MKNKFISRKNHRDYLVPMKFILYSEAEAKALFNILNDLPSYMRLHSRLKDRMIGHLKAQAVIEQKTKKK